MLQAGAIPTGLRRALSAHVAAVNAAVSEAVRGMPNAECVARGALLQVSTRILGRRTAPLSTFPCFPAAFRMVLPKILVLTRDYCCCCRRRTCKSSRTSHAVGSSRSRAPCCVRCRLRTSRALWSFQISFHRQERFALAPYRQSRLEHCRHCRHRYRRRRRVPAAVCFSSAAAASSERHCHPDTMSLINASYLASSAS